MLPHLSHLLQPLDVVSYSLLKRHYGDRILLLPRIYIYYINKETFLLVSHNPNAVLLKLDVQLRTPTPPALGTIA
jgi:hypothetical protein